MLIAFTGAQSTGKTTLLEACKRLDEFKGYTFVDEVTRRIKRTHGVAINNDADNYDQTQKLIIDDHIKNSHLKNAVLDRCIVDGYVYTQYFYEKGKVSEYVSDLAHGALIGIIDRYDIIFYTEPDIPLVDDKERSMDVKFRDDIIKLFNIRISAIEKLEPNKVVRLRGSVEDRLNTIKKAVANHQK